jgi:hypothetical protein
VALRRNPRSSPKARSIISNPSRFTGGTAGIGIGIDVTGAGGGIIVIGVVTGAAITGEVVGARTRYNGAILTA